LSLNLKVFYILITLLCSTIRYIDQAKACISEDSCFDSVRGKDNFLASKAFILTLVQNSQGFVSWG